MHKLLIAIRVLIDIYRAKRKKIIKLEIQLSKEQGQDEGEGEEEEQNFLKGREAKRGKEKRRRKARTNVGGTVGE